MTFSIVFIYQLNKFCVSRCLDLFFVISWGIFISLFFLIFSFHFSRLSFLVSFYLLFFLILFFRAIFSPIFLFKSVPFFLFTLFLFLVFFFFHLSTFVCSFTRISVHFSLIWLGFSFRLFPLFISFPFSSILIFYSFGSISLSSADDITNSNGVIKMLLSQTFKRRKTCMLTKSAS